MIAYIFKMVLCSAILIATYYLFLEREKIHRFKRCYLVTSLILSLIIPLITIEMEQEKIVSTISQLEEYVPINIPFTTESSEDKVTETVNLASYSDRIAPDFNWITAILIIYGIVTAGLLFRLCNNFFSIISDVNNKSTRLYLNATIVFHDKYLIPYSFLNYVFIREEDYHNRQILLHEMTHVRQQHSLDVLLAEFIHCLLWFNPAMILYKRAIRLNHEFLADDAVIKNFPTINYQQVLFQKAQLGSVDTLASSLNYLATKKRFIMMTTMKNQTRAMLKTICSFLVICCAVIIFSEKVYAQVMDTTKTKSDAMLRDSSTSQNDTLEFDMMISGLKKNGVNKNGKPNTWYNLTSLTDEDKQKLIALYAGMTEKQKANPERSIIVLFCHPPKPPIKQAPTAQELADLADPNMYGIWLDGKRVANIELAKYKPSDIAIVWKSRLTKNAAHYGQYKFHTDVMTHAYFDKTYSAKSN